MAPDPLNISDKDREDFTPEELDALPNVEYTEEDKKAIDRQTVSMVEALNRNALKS